MSCKLSVEVSHHPVEQLSRATGLLRRGRVVDGNEVTQRWLSRQMDVRERRRHPCSRAHNGRISRPDHLEGALSIRARAADRQFHRDEQRWQILRIADDEPPLRRAMSQAWGSPSGHSAAHPLGLPMRHRRTRPSPVTFGPTRSTGCARHAGTQTSGTPEQPRERRPRAALVFDRMAHSHDAAFDITRGTSRDAADASANTELPCPESMATRRTAAARLQAGTAVPPPGGHPRHRPGELSATPGHMGRRREDKTFSCAEWRPAPGARGQFTDAQVFGLHPRLHLFLFIMHRFS